MRKKSVIIKCQYCGVAFNTFPAVPSSPLAKYCSRKCFFHAYQTSKECICRYCGKTFLSQPHRVKSGRGLYCSQACKYASDRNRVIKKCLYCNTQFEVIPSGNRNNRGKYCSHKCYALAHAGINHHHWRGGHRYYRGSNWHTQRKLAYERDGGVCQICKKKSQKGYKNSVHHIKAFRLFNGDYKTANQLNNLITLCQSCHMKVEQGKINTPVHLF